mmetsp:Transcript_18861/g.41948  ORF Transcript_18861/g.41948 Transcript_18861/m.41948 type:complete len:222 (+) Transcript_18861:114-779(+)
MNTLLYIHCVARGFYSVQLTMHSAPFPPAYLRWGIRDGIFARTCRYATASTGIIVVVVNTIVFMVGSICRVLLVALFFLSAIIVLLAPIQLFVILTTISLVLILVFVVLLSCRCLIRPKLPLGSAIRTGALIAQPRANTRQVEGMAAFAPNDRTLISRILDPGCRTLERRLTYGTNVLFLVFLDRRKGAARVGATPPVVFATAVDVPRPSGHGVPSFDSNL